MDNSWQRKCDMTWQSSPSSSQQRPSQNHNQFQHQILNGNYHFNSSVPEKPTPSIHRLAPEASTPCTSNLGSYNLLYSELGSSFLSLLSGPPCVTRNEVPFGGNNFSGCAAGGEASLLSSGLLGQNLDNQNVEAGEDLGLIVPSKERATTNRGCNFGLNNVLQGAYSNLEKLELTKAGIHQKLSCSENRTDFSSPKVAYENGTTPFNVWKIHPSNTVGISQKVPSKTDPSVSSLPSNLLSGCPRVFCLGLSGDLLLSNTGLLGVLCSCHGLHMSISKFSEHSGICNINPGDAVRMDSGETIAQWRKAYFCKFGIRIPEDNSGWDWPQGLSATAGLMKRGPTLACMSTISVLSNQGSPFGASVQSENPWSHILLPKFSHTGQKVVDEFVHCEKQKNTHEQLKNTQERTNLLFKGLSSSSNNSLNFVADNQMIGHSRSGLPKMPNLVGVRDSYNFCGAISSYKDPFSKSGDSVFSPYLHNLKTLGKVNAIGRSVGSLVDRDIASSNVELRLGQPSQHSQTSRSSLTPASDYHLLVTHGQPQKSLFLDQHVHKSGNSTSTQESRQPSYLTGILSSSSTSAEEIQMDNVNHVRGVYDVPNTSQIELLKGDPPRRPVTSTSLTNLRSPCEETKHFKSMNDVINVNHVLVSKLDSESHPAESFPLLSGEAMDTRFSHTVLGGQKHDNVDQVGCTFDGLHGTSELNLGSHIKSKEKMRSFSGVAGDSDPMNYAAFCGKVPNMCESTGMMANEIDTRNMLNSFGQVSYPGQNGEHDPNVFRTITSTMDLGACMSSEAVSMGISATNLIPIKSLTPSSNKENIGRSPYFVDENTKILASHPLSALCNQNLAICTSKAITGQEGSGNSCRKKEVVIPSSVTGTRKKGLNFENVPNASEVATNTLLSANMMFGDGEKLPSVTDTDKWCFPVPAVSQGWYCHGKDTEIQCQFKSDLQHTRQFFLRFGGNENVTASSEDGKCYQRLPYGSFQNKCICARNSSCLNGRHDLVGETSIGKFTEQEANAVGLVTPFFSPKRSENYPSAEKDNSNSFGQSKNMVQNMEKPNGNSFQWRDVPRKVTAKCSLMCEATNSFKGNVECSVTDATASATKCFEKSALHALKGQETSNISSGCSAPAVTEASVEVNNKDSSTVDAGYAGSADNHVVDEGSGIERCWSSDDDSERSAEFYGIASKYNLMDKLSSKTCFSNPSHDLIHDLRFRDSIKLRKVQSRTSSSFPVRSTNNLLQRYENSRMGKRRTVKWKRLDSSISASALSAGRNGASKCADDAGQCSQLLKNFHMLPQTDQGSFTGCPFSFGQHLKHRRSTLSSSGAVSKKRDLPRIHRIEEEKADSDTNSNAKSAYLRASKAMGRKRLRLVGDTEPLKQDDVHDSTCIVSEQTTKVTGVDCNTTSSKSVKVCHSRRRPVVCGKYGIISNANSLKPPKIVSLEMILKATSRFSFAESWKVDYIPVKESKAASCNAKKEINNEGHNVVSAELNPRHSEEKETASFLGSKDSDDLLHTVKKRRCEGNRSHAIRDRILNTQLKRKFKEVRKRSIYELTSREIVSRPLKSPILKNGISVLPMKTRSVCKLAENAGDERMLTDTICNNKKSTKEVNCRNSWDLDVFCCVCGSSNTDESNWLLECSRCEIKVHQACYGISKVPKALWHCRPCKTSSENIVCVLCGYGGGAMTRALRSGNIVKSLLKVWSIPTEYSSGNPSFSESSESPLEMMSLTKSVCQSDPFLIMKPPHVDSHSVALRNTDISEHVDTVELPSSTPAAPVMCNSITAGVLDSTVKQWVHMVCGLWTPGTRCPNVDTMSAFDVSGACQPKQDVICSICQRSGGCCIECRVADCFVQFHPWCAHQKGLLQSEVEGIHGESVGFYGRCMLHARFHQFDSYSDHTNNADHGERVSTCARTEGYKGRKSDGFHHNLPHHSNGRSGCLVPQEQLNAWVHINGQKSCTRGPVKLPTSVIEDDCRKEYARYKQSRGWKHLVVYKSGIHGLGLYTSQFISRSAMVVEYVGEIVGLHVADRRETEYQAGKKLQYKTACYFFRIDKERIIDATRKGGIARFVNHSCLPNCVAKVISMRNEKKVVFFAERDIYPGEEVTYDYHFNHEDEGKKIPCYCNSNNCRRYLN